MTPPIQRTGVSDASDVEQIHHLEMYVANLHQAAYFYRAVLGFSEVREVAGGASHPSDRTSIALRRGEVRLLLTAPLVCSSAVNDHIARHGEGIRDIAFSVRNVERLFERAVSHGARPLLAPAAGHFAWGSGRLARIATCGDIVHTLIERPDDPAGQESAAWADDSADPPDTALDAIDHIAIALGAGELERWVDFYCAALGFCETHQENVSTEYSAMRSKVVATPDGAVRFPLLEPAEGRRQSQIDVFLQSHEGHGAQHLAFRSHDIVKSVSALGRGIHFLPTPATYYDLLEARVGALPPDIEELRRHGILVDSDAAGVLLQIFTKPIGTRPTLFLEIIERRGARGFGSGNIKALFEAVERLQAAAL